MSTRWLPDLVTTWGLVGIFLGAAAAGHSTATPTGLSWWDPLLTACFVAVVTVSISFSPRWLWFAAGAVNVALAQSGTWALVALFTLALALSVELHQVRSWVVGVGVGISIAHGLLNLQVGARFGLPTAVAAALSITALVLGTRSLPSRWRRRATVGYSVLGFLALLAAGAGALAALQAEPAISDGADSARAGLNAARNGDAELATRELNRAVESLADADGKLHSWWAQPIQLLPVASQHIRVAKVATSDAHSVAQAAGTALVDADIDELRVSNGALDLALIESMAGPLAAVEQSLEETLINIELSRSPWLVAPINRQLDNVVGEMNGALPDARKAADATRLLPALLGKDEPRRYLVLFATPAESRELGGIVGNVAELTADNGRVTITRQLRDAELNSAGPGQLADRGSYPARFLINRPETFSQNWSGMTDLPSVARAVADLYPTMGGRPIDGVLYADPYGIAALMQFTGAIEVPELDRTLDAESVVPFLLVEQYGAFEQDDRVNFLDQIAGVTFSRLLAAELPSPRRIGDVLGPAARQGRLQMATFDQEENDFLNTMFLLGSLPEPDGQDHLAVVHANGGGDKLDSFLQRTVRYQGTVDPATGALSASATIDLRNDVPDGLPAYVIGSEDRPVPQATNLVHLSIYTSHQLLSVRVNDTEVNPEIQQELGFQRYLTFIEIAQGETATVTFDLVGAVDVTDGSYRLTVAPQAVANPDRLIIEMTAGQNQLVFDGPILEDTVFEIELSR